jgi:outer membrane lipase/esterase
MKIKILLIVLFCLSLVTPLKASAQEYNRIFIFGDSLSDSGKPVESPDSNAPTSTTYFHGRQTNGLVWVEDLSRLLNMDTTSMFSFALSGSTSGAKNITSSLPGVEGQVNQFTSTSGTINENDLFIVWAGTVDHIVPSLTEGKIAVNNLSNTFTTLASKGARNIIVVNLYDLGKIPSEYHQADKLTTETNNHNSQLHATLQAFAAANPNINIIPLDINAFFKEISADPGKYHLTNVTDGYLSQVAKGIAANPDQYLFFDTIHPTARAHELIAEYAYSVLTAPQAVIPQGEIALQVAKKQHQFVNARLQALRNSTIMQSTNKWDVYASSDINISDANYKQNAYSSTTSGVAVGTDYRFTKNLAAGIALSFVDNQTDLRQNLGNIDTNGYAVSLYSNFIKNNFYISGAASYGDNDFDIKRKIAFDNRTAAAKTSSNQFSANLNSGYIAKSGNISYGPIIGLKYDRIYIDGYTEKGAGSLNMKVDGQQAESLVLNVGTQLYATLNTSIGSIIPHISASYEHQFANDSRTVVTELVTQPGIPRRTKTPEYDRNYFKIAAGTQFIFTKNLSGGIGWETTIGRDDINDNVIHGEIRYQF